MAVAERTTGTPRPIGSSRSAMGRVGLVLRWIALFVGPFVLGLLIFSYLPIIWSLVLSFFEAYNTATPSKFVGLQNYIDMLADRNFLSSLGTFTIIAVFIVPLTFAL